MKDKVTETHISLDVRPVLAAGEEPFNMIMEAARRVSEGGELEITAPFEPVPLYRVLSQHGFAHRTEVRDLDAFVVRFTKTGVTSKTTVSEVYERYPSTAGVLARYGFDLCCGGSKSLAFAAQAHGVEIEMLLEELQDAILYGGER